MKASVVVASAFAVAFLCSSIAVAQTQPAQPLPKAPPAENTRESLEKAAAAGDAQAMNDLGELYYEGKGVPQDYQKAKDWYEKAVDAGNAKAMRHLGYLYERGRECRRTIRKRRSGMRKRPPAGTAVR